MSSIRTCRRSLYVFAALLTFGGASGCVSVFSADESGFVEGSDDTTNATRDDTTPTTDTSGATSEDIADTSGATSEDIADTDTTTIDTCQDSALNGDETDLDCGGSCAPCASYRFCKIGADCINGVCDPDEDICSPPTCLDGAANGQETDIDCGGPNCNECADDLSCTQNSDCEGGFCYQGVCTSPSCADQLRNGGESDIDCGGPNCGACAPTQRCDAATDCDSGVCNGQGRCEEPTCADSVRNGDEVGTDCGAASGCGPCVDGEACATTDDCVSLICDSVSSLCIAPACDDTVRNGQETDVDCGGDCAPCPDGLDCLVSADCASLICDASTLQCVNAGCIDNVRNGQETDVDCGGPSCAPCALNLACTQNSDCVSNKCQTSNPKVCVAPVCGDGLIGPGEACDDGNTSNTDACAGCQVAACGDSFVRQGVEQCDDGNASNTDACTSACQNAVCGDRFVRQGVEQCDDGNTSNTDLCTTTCALTTCTDNARNADETDVDCGGRCGATCGIGKACSGDADCGGEGLCQGSVCAFGSSCMALLNLGYTDSRVYTLDVDGPFGGKPAFQAYCDQQSEGGGWTLAMKVPTEGAGDPWGYGDARWTNAAPYREGDAGWDRREAKLLSAVYMPFTEVMVALEVPGRQDPEEIAFEPLVLRAVGASLTQLFSQGQRVDTNAGRGEWVARVGGVPLPPMTQCDKEGFNLDYSTAGRARVGFVTSSTGSCSYSQNSASWIGIGSQGQACGAAPSDAVVGFSACDGVGGREWQRGFGALFVR